MGINKYKIKKWVKMIFGKSIHHVNQGIGKIYNLNFIKGYYNDLTEKVLRGEELDSVGVPITITDTGKKYIFQLLFFNMGLELMIYIY